jgi:predicted dehydrogenase/threonine dehydrogenase-like Zn-dependent dehydrogenase
VKQVVQPVSGGPVEVVDIPRPAISPTEVLVETQASVISAGTERAVTSLARANLLSKARARPDLVRRLVKKARTEGIAPALRAVRGRLGEALPLGYSGAGIAVEVGDYVEGVAPGQLVATGGAGKANHAEFQAAPGLLCVTVPDGVPAEDAAFSTIASVALHGLRLAEVEPGSRVVVIGLGLLGQLAVRLAQVAGCHVAGIDLAEFAVRRAGAAGAEALVERGEETTEGIIEWSRGRGADAVLLTAATKSSDAVLRVPALCRDRATVVVVGDVGLALERAPFYEKELSLRFARSYGPGRYERSYEEWGVDYPPGQVRFTEGRNLESILELLGTGRLVVSDLITHRFSVTEAADAYDLVESRREPYLGVSFTYEGAAVRASEVVRLRPPRRGAADGIGLVGAGTFASSVLIPAFKEAGFSRFVCVASASGLSARQLAARSGFEKAVSGAEAVLDDSEVGIVVIATPHDSHASLTADALRRGKHVFCEKPLSISMEELDEVVGAWESSGASLFVGFNRRWSPAIAKLRTHFVDRTGPLVVTYRVNAGSLSPEHWYRDRRQGGRLLGEVCHFIDTCGAIVGEDAVAVDAMGSGQREPVLEEDFVVSLRYPSGSVATISYASGGHPSTDKERIEVLGRGRTAVVADFRQVILDEKTIRLGRQDKGHAHEALEFRRCLGSERDDSATLASIATTKTTLLAVDALRRLSDPTSADEAQTTRQSRA